MTVSADVPLVALLNEPARITAFNLGDWDLLIRQARACNLLARVADVIQRSSLMLSVPPAPRVHLESARLLAAAQRAEVLREVEFIRLALAPIGVSPIFLKGAAYTLADIHASYGRLFSDIDIFVPRGKLSEVELALKAAGWGTLPISPYDQYYYREWMHELPPMQHKERGAALDVHHAILPLTARSNPNPVQLAKSAIPVDSVVGVLVLNHVDMLLHSVAHLFFNEDLRHGTRDLSDLDILMREFGVSETFWRELVDRAESFGLARVLFYALHLAKEVFRTPVPDTALLRISRYAPSGFIWVCLRLFFLRVLVPPRFRHFDPLLNLSLFALYVRGHWLRMPFPMLIRHLSRKTVDRLRGRDAVF